MNENNSGLRIISALVLIAVIAAIGFFAFQAGVAKGSPITIEAPSGQTAPVPYPHYGYGWGMPFHRPFGFGLFGFLFVIFLFFIALRALRVLFWGPRWGWGHPMGHHRHGPWGHWENGVPPTIEEWHKRMHGGEAGQSEEKKE